MRIVALITAYNEADVIGRVLDDLVDQRIEVHFIDNASTDGTAEIAAERLGKGVVAVERYPAEGASSDYPWAALLARKQELAASIDADWFLHHDADELRESPWPGLDLRAGIELVDRLGFNAIDFEVLHFRPVDDRFVAGDDLRERFHWYEPAESWDRLQIKAWKRQLAVDLVTDGGHEAVFTGRAVFPIRFLCRHYPIRSRAHGERKVLVERQPRFRPDELESGWHRQYERLAAERRFVWQTSDLRRFDAERVRAELWIRNREWEAAAGTPAARSADLVASGRRAEELSRRLDERNREADRLGLELDAAHRAASTLAGELAAERASTTRLQGESARLSTELDGAQRAAIGLGRELDVSLRAAERLGRELDARNRDAERLGLELDARNRETDRLGGELDGALRELQRLTGELALRERDLAAASGEVAAVRTELEREQAAGRFAAARSELELDRLRAAIARLEAEIESARAERSALAAELERLLTSRTWRWSAPFRRLFWRLAGGAG